MNELLTRGRKARSMPRITRTGSRGRDPGQAPLHPSSRRQPPATAAGQTFPSGSLNSIVRPSTSPSSTLFMDNPSQVAAGVAAIAQQREQQTFQTQRAPPLGGEESHIAQLMRRTSNGAGRRAVANNAMTTNAPPTTVKGRPASSAEDFMNQRPPSRGLEPIARDMGDTANMCVEGVQTGEEVLVESSVAAETRGADEAGKGNKRNNQSRKERLLELEVKRLHALLAQEKKEMAHVKNSYMTLRDQFASLGKMEERIEALERETREKSEVIGEGRAEQLALKQMLLDEQKKHLDADVVKSEQILEAKNRIIELQERVQRAEREKKDMSDAWSDAVQQGMKAKEKLKDIEMSTADSETQMTTLKSQQKSREAMIAQLKAALAEEAAASEKARRELKEVRDDLISKEAAVIDLRRTADQMTEYITKICQPHFAVVKDDSLAPVNLRGFQVTEGHVLVPLILLLEGYSLLPTQTRNAIDLKSSRLGRGIDYAGESTSHLPSAPALEVTSDMYKKDVYSSHFS